MKELQYSFCRTTFDKNQDYLVWLTKKADFKESGTCAMFKLGSHYYHGNMGSSEKYCNGHEALDSGMFHHKETCYNFAFFTDNI